MIGYIKINRKILEWEWYKNINTKVLFLHCLLKANWKDGKFEGKVIPKGSFVTSIPHLSEETLLTVREVRTAIGHLKMTGELTVETTNKYSIITVNNYCLYQCTDTQNGSQETVNSQSSDSQVTVSRHSNDILTTTIEEGKNIRRKEGKKEKREEDNNTSSVPQSVSHEQAVIKIPLNDKTYREIYQSEIDHWSELYPAVDILQELRKMVGWCESNPQNRKTRRGSNKFITNWLSKSQDKAARIGSASYMDVIKNRVSEVDNWI